MISMRTIRKLKNRFRATCIAALAAALFLTASCKPAAPKSEARPPSQFASVAVYPTKITLIAGQGSQHVLVTGVAANGLEANVTTKTTFSSSHSEVAG